MRQLSPFWRPGATDGVMLDAIERGDPDWSRLPDHTPLRLATLMQAMVALEPTKRPTAAAVFACVTSLVDGLQCCDADREAALARDNEALCREVEELAARVTAGATALASARVEISATTATLERERESRMSVAAAASMQFRGLQVEVKQLRASGATIGAGGGAGAGAGVGAGVGECGSEMHAALQCHDCATVWCRS